MFSFRNRFIDQRCSLQRKFEERITSEPSSLKLDEKDLDNLQNYTRENLNQTIKGLGIGAIISTYVAYNLKGPTMGKHKKKSLILISLPLISTTFFSFLIQREKYNTYLLYLSLKYL